MKLRNPNKSVRTLGTAIAAAALMTGGGNAFAEPVSLELEFTCPFPLIGEQPIRAQISADVPTQATVGQPTPEFTVDALTTVNEDSSWASSWWVPPPLKAPPPMKPLLSRRAVRLT
nr:DUF6801 domain-containing protein [Marinobacter sp. DS40M8]